MLADEVDYVVGVDTHRDRHTLAVVAAPTGAVVAQLSVRTDASGYSAAVRFAERYAAGVRVWAVEGAGHYGAGLARQLAACGETVLESGRPARVERRLKGKDDSLDAIRAARTVLGGEQRTLPRAGQRQARTPRTMKSTSWRWFYTQQHGDNPTYEVIWSPRSS